MSSQYAIDLIFRQGRTYHKWLKKDVPNSLLEEIYDIAKMGPTAANCSPLRITFVKSIKAKEKLKVCLDQGNIEKTMNAPITAIFAYDLEFYKSLPKLFPHVNASTWFIGNEELILETAMRNCTLQAAYFIIAARSLGLDCGPMSGFNREMVDKEFFLNSKIKSNFLCNLGYGDKESLKPRNYRLPFNKVAQIL